jgi:hypothetical protein
MVSSPLRGTSFSLAQGSRISTLRSPSDKPQHWITRYRVRHNPEPDRPGQLQVIPRSAVGEGFPSDFTDPLDEVTDELAELLGLTAIAGYVK